MEGRVWVDGEDFAVIRLEGAPAKSPSFWTRNVRVMRSYEKVGGYWFAKLAEFESDIFLVGMTKLRIEFSEYRIGR